MLAHTPSINYVIAAWSGLRRGDRNPNFGKDCNRDENWVRDKKYDKDRRHYLKFHLEQLKKYKSHVTQITIVCPDNPHEPKYFQEFLKRLPAQIRHIPVVVLRRPNYGFSFGSFSYAYDKYKNFTYYIFTEDDYVFIRDYFDLELITRYESLPKCGFLCSYIADRQKGCTLLTDDHFLVSVGLTSADVLAKIWQKHKSIPHAKHGGASQIAFLRAFLDEGYLLYDYASDFRIPFQWPSGRFNIYGNRKAPILSAPTQYITDRLLIEHSKHPTHTE